MKFTFEIASMKMVNCIDRTQTEISLYVLDDKGIGVSGEMRLVLNEPTAREFSLGQQFIVEVK